MMKLGRLSRLAGLLIIAVSLAGCGGGESPNGTSPVTALEVPAVYKQHCISCHGNQLQGRAGPNLQTVGSRMDEAQLAGLIRDGKGGMPSYGKRLSDDEINTLASWLADQK